MRYLIMCRSLTYAQRASRVLEKAAITVGIQKAPNGLSKNGCSYCVTVSDNKVQKAIQVLKREGLLQGKIYEQDAAGNYREVIL